VFRLLLIIAVLLGTVALIQFVWAMGSVYLLGKDITDNSVYILSNMPADSLEIVWRYGIFKTTSLTYHAYILGLFNLLIFTIYFYSGKRAKIKTVIPLLSGVLTSVSRMAYGGLFFVTLLHFIKRKKWVVLLLLLLIGILSLNKIIHYKTENTGYFNIRAQTQQKALETWKDHPLMGVGPGMFGGIVASKYYSYIYEQYNVSDLSYINSVGGIEQFWFQILAEMGIVGALLFINFIVFLFITLYKSREQATSQDLKNLFSGLIAFIPCILIVTIGSGINIAPMLFTYCAFAGIGLGCRD
jgi:O-antigen ligase